ncbi:MAG: hypothetical protein IRZ08_19630, partial [Frankia sp.]|nr:hypothetical protein [Frankia sp.]
MPNRGGIEFLRLLGRSTRFRSTAGEWAVPAGVPLLGRWLTWFAQCAEHPGSSTLLALTDVLSRHWASGQSALEDASLAALLGWIDPPPGLTGRSAARLAEDPRRSPPAGPATDPWFDNHELAPAIAAYEAARDRPQTDPDRPAALERAEAALRSLLAGQLEPTWRLMWRAIGLLRALPAAATVGRRWDRDRARFSDYYTYLRDNDGGRPQPRRDNAVAAARRLATLERDLAELEADAALDDPLVLARYRVSGEAFVGTVVAVDRERRIPNERGTLVTRPTVTLRTADPVRLLPRAKVVSPARRNQVCELLSIAGDGRGLLVTLQVNGGMG